MTDLGLRVVKAARVVAVREQQVQDSEAALAREQERQAVVASAYARGFDDGVARAAQDGADAAMRSAAALEQLVAAVQSRHVEEVAATSRAVLAAALDISEWILRHELPRDTRSIVARLDEAARSLMPSPVVRVCVSPSDEQAVRTWAAGRSGLEVVVDPGFAAGNATYETDAGAVDVSIAAALRIAAEALGVDPARGPA